MERNLGDQARPTVPQLINNHATAIIWPVCRNSKQDDLFSTVFEMCVVTVIIVRKTRVLFQKLTEGFCAMFKTEWINKKSRIEIEIAHTRRNETGNGK